MAATDTATTAGAASAWHALSSDDALSQQGVDVAKGLTASEVAARVAEVRPEQVR